MPGTGRGTASACTGYCRRTTFEGLEALFRAFFAGIPHQWHTKNDIARYEGYYASVFYSHFAAAGLDVRVEDSTSRGRLDMTVLFNDEVYLFEFKTVGKEPTGGRDGPAQGEGLCRQVPPSRRTPSI